MKLNFIFCMAAVWGAIFCSPVLAQSSVSVPMKQERNAFSLHLGYQGSYNRTEIAYETPSLWNFSLLNRPVDVKLEASFAYWHTNHSEQIRSTSRNNLWNIGLTPMFRWWMGDSWYIEAGIGPVLMSHTQFANKRISTRFQFGDHLGVVKTLGSDWRLGIRLSHFSNASIKQPNPGLNLVQFTISRLF